MSTDSDDSGYSKDLHWPKKVSFQGFTGSSRLVDLAFAIFCLLMITYYLFFISTLKVPQWDGAVYMLNAHEWLTNTNLREIFRPPLFSWIIGAIWTLTGEDWTVIKHVQMVFTVASIILLYILLKRRKGSLFAFGVSTLTLSNAYLFYFTSQILTDGISLFFLILTLYFLECKKQHNWVLAGVSMGLTFATRYPIFLQALVIFAVESISRREKIFTLKAAVVTVSVILLVILMMYSKTGLFEVGGPRSTNFGFALSPFYVINSIAIWGPAILLLPVAFLFKSTFKDKFNYIFIAWFVLSFIFWSANTSNHQERFMIQFMPAAYFLVILALENLIKFNKNNLIFLKSKS
jgi:4-amino-4-deoxy-L-arabinose transferase-like glycosyltransferase